MVLQRRKRNTAGSSEQRFMGELSYREVMEAGLTHTYAAMDPVRKGKFLLKYGQRNLLPVVQWDTCKGSV